MKPLSWLVITRPRAFQMLSRLKNWPEGMVCVFPSLDLFQRDPALLLKGFCFLNPLHAGTHWVKCHFIPGALHLEGWGTLWGSYGCVSCSDGRSPPQVHVPAASPGEVRLAQQTLCVKLSTVIRERVCLFVFFHMAYVWLQEGEMVVCNSFCSYLGPIKLLIWEWWAAVSQLQSNL